MKRIIQLVTILMFAFCSVVTYAAQDIGNNTMIRFYVSPYGDDNAKGSIEEPFATFERAQKEIRKYNKKMTGNIEVVFREGLYRFDKTVHLNGEDSASNGYKIIYRAYENETPVFTGARKLEGKFRETPNGWWEMPIEKGIETRMLMIDGKTRILARFPNDELWSKFSYEGVENMYWQMRLDDRLYDILDGTEKNISYRALRTYREIGGTLTEIHKTDDGKVFGYVKQESVLLDFAYNGTMSKIHLENSLKFLDYAGEYYIDSDKGMLYYIPTRNEIGRMDSLNVEYAYLSTILSLDGEDYKKVSGIEVDGISFTGTAQNNLMKDGYSDICCNYQDDYSGIYDKDVNPIFPGRGGSLVSNFYDAAIDGRWVENITIHNCKFYQMREAAIVFMNGCRNIKVKGCLFDHIGSSAVNISLNTHTSKKTSSYLENIEISNNLMYHISEDHCADGAIIVNAAKNLKVENNDIEFMSYGGLVTNLIYLMDYQIWKTGDYTIRGNRIIDTARSAYINDTGPIYNAGPLMGKNIIENNYVKAGDIGWTDTYGIYFDSNNRNWTARNNVIEGFRMRPIYLQIVASQIATNVTTVNNYVSPLPVFYYGNVSKSLEFRQDKNLRQDILSYALPTHFPDAAKKIMEESGLTDEYKHLYDEIEKPYNLKAYKPYNRYRFKEGITGNVPAKVTNNTSEPIYVDFSVQFSTQPTKDYKYTALIPANTEEYVVNIPVTIENVNKIEVGSIMVIGQFETGEVIRAGVDASYQYVAEVIDCFMVDTESDGYEEQGIWCSESWRYDIYGRPARMAKNTNRASCSYTPNFLPDGDYKIILGGCYSPYNDEKAFYELFMGDDKEEFVINQKGTEVGAEWELGVFTLKGDEKNYIKYTRRDYSKEAANSGIGAYVCFERQNSTPEEIESIKRAYIEHMSIDKVNKGREEDVIILHPSDDSESFSSTTRMDPVILKNGRECEKLTNGYTRLHFEELLSDGIYEVFIYKNVSKSYADKMDLVLVHADGTLSCKYSLREGNEGWHSVGTFRFSSDAPAEVLISKNLLAHGTGIVDDVKFVRIK